MIWVTRILGLVPLRSGVDEYYKAIDAGWRAYQPYIRSGGLPTRSDGNDAEEAIRCVAISAEARRLEYDQLTFKWRSQTHSLQLYRLYEGLRKAGLPEE